LQIVIADTPYFVANAFKLWVFERQTYSLAILAIISSGKLLLFFLILLKTASADADLKYDSAGALSVRPFSVSFISQSDPACLGLPSQRRTA